MKRFFQTRKGRIGLAVVVLVAVAGCAERAVHFATAEIVARYNLSPAKQCDVSHYAGPIEQARATFSRGMIREDAFKEFPLLARSFGKGEQPKEPCRIEIELEKFHSYGIIPPRTAHTVTVIMEHDQICLNFVPEVGQKGERDSFPSGKIRNPKKDVPLIISLPGPPIMKGVYLPPCYDRDGNFKRFRKDL